ncbi:radical SAM/SPASM domain-containing protein [Porphyromonas levii]|uniref:radical SAM/SPASM domain-containing protein n=2 Tax=Porphyromonas levii TaxID=28114 RepID=UPI001070D946|nr:radical SAM protein [Porphyromonas levii]MBR8714082.1 PqqA peptide cyclase [Porphyromonas levii]MBR8716079.1 PqqA peptide cyclase [Porphyromonas levii]MBR8728621.1 PqqA peptide cyclase [Porphyromonas levii]MBR8736971.1 PqqA peptide cyclase [Porphyromonas levii]MBR8779028.1 PqqA peptide cyclase [Porphyromonas levii]
MNIFISNRWQFRYEPSLKGKYFLYDLYKPKEFVINRSIINLLYCIEKKGTLAKVCKEINVEEDNLISIIKRLNSAFPELITTVGTDKEHSPINIEKKYHQFHLDFPKSAEIQITDKCNLFCKHCIASSSPKLGTRCIDPKYWCQLLDELDYMRTYKVTITGGEMLTYEGIEEILEKAAQSRIHFYLLTNATLINERWAQLLSMPNMTVSVSIDGAKAKTHDFLRGKEAYIKLQKGLNLLLEHNAKIELSVTVHSHNYQELEDLIIFGIKKGCKGITFVLLDNSGRAAQNSSLHLSAELTCIIVQKIESLRIKYSDDITVSYINPAMGLSNMRKDYHPERKVYCTGAVSHIAISPNGDVYPCAFAFGDESFNSGNIKCSTISQLWNNRKWSIMRGELLYKDLHICSSCEHKEECTLINCRIRALQFSGDILGTPACIRVKNINY